MKISVLIPCFNSGPYLAGTLASVAKQGYSDLEVIIVDGGSTDSTSQVVDAYGSWVNRFISEPDRGQLDAIMKAVSLATGDICYWLNADDIVMPMAFDYVASVFKREPRTDIVFSDDYAFSEEKRKLWVGGTIKGMNFNDHFLFYRQMYSECIFWRRNITDQVLPVDYDLRVYTDYSFFLPLRHGRKCRWVPQRLGAFRVVENQMSRLHQEKAENERELIKQRMRERLGINIASFNRAQKRHRLSFLLRQKYWPKFISGVRYTGRKLTGDRSRNQLAKFFFDDWLVPSPEIREKLKLTAGDYIHE